MSKSIKVLTQNFNPHLRVGGDDDIFIPLNVFSISIHTSA